VSTLPNTTFREQRPEASLEVRFLGLSKSAFQFSMDIGDSRVSEEGDVDVGHKLKVRREPTRASLAGRCP
jgi:hypothetical protein